MKKFSISKKLFFPLLGLLTPLLLAGCSTMNASLNSTEVPVKQNVYPLPAAGNDIVGRVFKIKSGAGDTLDKIGETYDIGAEALRSANPHLRNKLAEDTSVTIPAQYVLPPAQFRKGIVINIAAMRLYYFDKANNTVLTFPVAVGKQGWDTPLGQTYVYRKEVAPTWNVPKSIRDAYFEKTGLQHPRQIGPGPENPLGDYAIFLHLNGYLIHGNNAPNTIGRSVSSGCVRMFNQDVAKLYDYVGRGTPVSLIYYPNMAGWQDGKLYLASYKVLEQPDGGDPQNKATAKQAIEGALAERAGSIDWHTVQKVMHAHTGIPTQIATEK